MNTLLHNMYTYNTDSSKPNPQPIKHVYLFRSSDFLVLLGMVSILLIAVLLYLGVTLGANHFQNADSATPTETTNPHELWNEYV